MARADGVASRGRGRRSSRRGWPRSSLLRHGGRGAGLAAGDEEGEGGPGGRGAGPGASDKEVERGVRQWLRLREGRKGRDKGGECGSHWNLFKIYNLF